MHSKNEERSFKTCRSAVKSRSLNLLMASLLLVSGLTGCASVKAQTESVLKNPSVPKNEVVFHVLDVGQGLSIVAESGNQVLMYDGGDRNHSSYVVSWLKKNDITEINDMIASHYDADHLNGLVGALNTIKTDHVYAPDYTTETRVFKSFESIIKEKGIKLTHAYAGDSFKFGSAEVEFLAPEQHSYSEDNDYCEVVRISNGKTSVLITGDAEKESEQEMVDKYGDQLKSDIYVAGHHGSSSSSSAVFLDAVDPEAVIISCGKDNEYGHPHKEVVDEFKDRKLKVYRTDQQGEITFTLKEDTYTFSEKTAPNPYEPGSKSIYNQHHEEEHHSETHHSQPVGGPLMNDQSSSDNQSASYILNTSTKKIHLPDCKSVRKMKDKNKEAVNDTLADLKAKGYTPCQNCLKGK